MNKNKEYKLVKDFPGRNIGDIIYWISQCKTWGFRLINLTEGGEGTLGIKFSKERRRKISESNSKIVYQYDLEGNFINEWYNATEAGKSIGKTNSKICACARGDRKTAYGYIWKYEKFDKIKPYIKPKHIVTEKNRLNLIKINSKPVLQYDLAMNFIKEWESAKVAAKELNLCRFSICNYLNGKRIEHKSKNKIGDFIWKRK